MDEHPLLPDLDGHYQGQQTKLEGENDPITLRKYIAQFEAIIDHLPEAVIVTDQTGRLKHMNRMAQSIFGHPPPDIDPKAWPEVFGFYLDDARTYYPGDHMPLMRALRGEAVEVEEMILRRAEDSDAAWIAMSAKPITDETNRISGTIVFFRDITHRKQIELSQDAQARRVEALYQFSHAVAASSNDLSQLLDVIALHTAQSLGDASLVALLDPRSDHLEVAAFHHPDSSIRARISQYLMSINNGLSASVMNEVARSGQPLLIPSVSPEQVKASNIPEFAKFVAETGVTSILIVPITGRNGNLGSIGLFRDQNVNPYTLDDQSFLTTMSQRAALAIENLLLISSLREQAIAHLSAKQALQVSEERFRSIFESTTLGIKVLDPEGNILQTNSAFQTMLGYTEAELSGKHFTDFHHPGDAKRAIRLVRDLKESGVPDFRLDHRTIHKDGSIVWVKTTFTGVKKSGSDNSLVFIVGIVENITEQKRTELEMAELKNRLQANVEMERLRLAQELHDGPMQELYSAIYQIDGLRSTLDSSQQGTLEMVRLDLQTVLDDLRATAKELRPPTLSDFGLEKAIRSYIEDFQEKHPGLVIHLQLAQDRQNLPENVRLGLFRILQQSLANVVRHAEASQIRVIFAYDAEEAVLEIIDNGKGFEIPRTWVRLVRQGHFGLAGAAERIDALGGSFRVESRPGEGTTVRVRVPIQSLQDNDEI